MWLSLIGIPKTCQVSIAIHRFITVVLNNHYSLCTKKFTLVALVLSPWISQFLVYVWPLSHIGAYFGYNNQAGLCGMIQTVTFSKINRVAVPISQLIIVSICYFAIWCKVYKSNQRLRRRIIRRIVPSAFRPDIPTNEPSFTVEQRVTWYAFGSTAFLFLCELTLIIPGLAVKTGTEFSQSTMQTLNMIHFFGMFVIIIIIIIEGRNLYRRMFSGSLRY